MNSPYPLPQGCIFREDFRNPTLAAQNGLVSVGSPGPTWRSKGVRFGVTNSFKLPYISVPGASTFIFYTQILFPFTGLYRTLLQMPRVTGNASEFGLANASNAIYLFSPGGLQTIALASSDSQIHQLAISSSAGNAIVYIDGASIGTRPFSTGSGLTGACYIGNNSSPVVGWNQDVEQARIYNYALSADEIAQDYYLTRGIQ